MRALLRDLRDKPWAAASNAIVPRVGHLSHDAMMRLAANEGHVEMDDSTQQLLASFRLQLKPIEARQEEILAELRSWRDKMQTLGTESALAKDRIETLRTDLNRGLSSIRKEMDEKLKGRNKTLTLIAGALATLTTVLIGLFLYWIKT